jgi:hypothetical protein
MGSIIPEETFPPKAPARNGTVNIPAPYTPVFAIPIHRATTTIINTSVELRSKDKNWIN